MSDGVRGPATEAIGRLAGAQEEQNELLERRNMLLEDQNALLYEFIRAYYHVSYTPEEERYHSAEHGNVPRPTSGVEDGLFSLNYIAATGYRTHGRPEEDDDR